MTEPTATRSEAMTPDEVMRYSRHIIMAQVGPQGQRKLRDAKVLVIGAGGLGGPVALYLALAGVGTIGIVEFDTVDLSNLQRQVLHQTPDIGKPKLQSAKEKLAAHNPHVKVIGHNVPITSDNAMEIISGYDIVVNGADNFATRYLVNDAAYLSGKTLVVPSCAEAGVLGAITGIVGSIQATEVFKKILGVGNSLTNRLLLVDALTMEFRTMKLRRDPSCPLCGDHPTVKELIDYDQFCGTPPLVFEGAAAAAH
jgi:molybdopterin/thiamine biosynthesis adenylyltransferase